MYNTLRPDFLLVDLRDFLLRIRVGGRKRSFKNDQLTGHFQSFFNISRKTVNQVRQNDSLYYILKYFIIFLNIWTGQSILIVSLSKSTDSTSKIYYYFQPNKYFLESADKTKNNFRIFVLLSKKIQ